ncbi:unnamed protein product [Rangifer tarandus platyrhynchus]|uniref:Uncharacterized protein n=1 Tax=Rangifer tarandus platyrhynchus TaxID=3082113 RepID=A0AC59ZKL3_RANTA
MSPASASPLKNDKQDYSSAARRRNYPPAAFPPGFSHPSGKRKTRSKGAHPPLARGLLVALVPFAESHLLGNHLWERRWPFRHHPDFAVAVDPCLRLRTFLAVPGSPVSTVGHRQKLEPLWFSRSVKMSWEIGLRRWSLEHTPDSPRLGGGGVTAR